MTKLMRILRNFRNNVYMDELYLTYIAGIYLFSKGIGVKFITYYHLRHPNFFASPGFS